MTDPTLSPHKPPVIEDDRELIDRLMHQIVVREDDLYAALAANERLKAVLRGYEQWEAALISRKGRGEMSSIVERVAKAIFAAGPFDFTEHDMSLSTTLAHAAVKAMEEPSHIANIRLHEAVTLALKRLDELDRDDEDGIRLVLADAISPLSDRQWGEK